MGSEGCRELPEPEERRIIKTRRIASTVSEDRPFAAAFADANGVRLRHFLSRSSPFVPRVLHPDAILPDDDKGFRRRALVMKRNSGVIGGPAAAAVLGLFLAAGMTLAAGLLGDAAEGLLASRRVVTVNGFAEREVAADLAVWPIAHSVSGDTLAEVQEQIADSGALIRDFLDQQGFDAHEISDSVPRIIDYQTQLPGLPNPPPERYTAESTVTLRTRNIDSMKAAMQAASRLVGRGIALTRSYEATPRFMFTGLDALKPQMIAEATVDARRAAQQFAQDSQSRVGAIRTARQGYFSISDLDAFSPERKTVRVVTTVEYFLVD